MTRPTYCVVSSNFSYSPLTYIMCVNIECPTHHRQFESRKVVLVPSKRLRELMHGHEICDFAAREEIMACEGRDPDRTSPEVSTIRIILC